MNCQHGMIADELELEVSWQRGTNCTYVHVHIV